MEWALRVSSAAKLMSKTHDTRRLSAGVGEFPGIGRYRVRLTTKETKNTKPANELQLLYVVITLGVMVPRSTGGDQNGGSE